ncbi:hypothetical protein SAMN04487770_12348 [Butyrivibrio sp. ob235]|uniref:hypothetical protein n=1 Tax=Butyrivibrio sp. ob235 TaxID=1761780 RepID=UPI0008D8513C|nr:hypothetical protein [Butyrivibrio sp. ob235]SEM01322.1 hypothetical protein SAMN04487770_12348 [Butyrivibrio sp. ob235]
MFAVDVFMAFFIAFVCFSEQGITEALVAGAAAALILVLSQKLKYLGTILITLQGGFMSIVIAMEHVSPRSHKSIYTWTCALILFVIYMIMNREIFDDNINGDVVDISDLFKIILTVILFPFYMIRAIFKSISNAIRNCFVLIKRLFATVKKLFHGQANKDDSTDNHYEQSHREQEYRYRKEQTNREQTVHEERATSNISYFQNCTNRSELIRAYRKWVKELHPDNGGNPEDFIRMSNEYDRLKTQFAC